MTVKAFKIQYSVASGGFPFLGGRLVSGPTSKVDTYETTITSTTELNRAADCLLSFTILEIVLSKRLLISYGNSNNFTKKGD